MSKINFHNVDNIEFMENKPDNYYDLAIIDPEYGINAGKKKQYRKNALTIYTSKEWDRKRVSENFLKDLFRISKNQIIFGYNYISDLLPYCKKPIVWDKMQPEGIDQAMFELIYNSQANIQAKIYRQSVQSNCNKVANNKRKAVKYIKIHPTQKPIKLYRWLLQNYAESGNRIIDTHGGSGSIAIACEIENFDLDICEIDKDYFDASIKRFELHKSQPRLF